MRSLQKRLVAALFCCLAGNTLAHDQERDLFDLSFEELLDLEVTSVGKKSQKLSDAAAAVFVITNEDLIRSGATSVAEALRMVPGVSVQQIDANKWSISARGFSSRFANKLLVLIDGRSIYTSSFSGVYWEVQDLVLDDIDRIEVIRGPGATLWGANAVNGVINIITRSARETTGGMVNASLGTDDQQGTLRYGGSISENTAVRTSLKYVDRDEYETADGRPGGDDWQIGHLAFRMDSERPGGDQLTVQGDYLEGRINQNLSLLYPTAPYQVAINDRLDTETWNLLGRWQRPLSVSSDFSLQFYVDHVQRFEALFGQELKTADLEFQHRFAWGERNDILWGLGYRYITNEFESRQVEFSPERRSYSLVSGFVQNDITAIKDRLKVTVGAKVEHNEFTGAEVQPNLRFVWTPGDRQSLWTAVSKASRTPSRAELDSRLIVGVLEPNTITNPIPFPIALYVEGDPEFASEELTAYEAGYRFAFSPRLNLDFAIFHNRYSALRTVVQGDPALVDFSYVETTLHLTNDGYAETSGLELAAEWRPVQAVHIQLAYSELDVDFRVRPGVTDLENGSLERASPKRQLSVISGLEVSEDLRLDVWARYVDAVAPPNVAGVTPPLLPDYWDLDFQLSWRPAPNWRISLVGQNLLESRRLEGLQESFAADRIEVPRSYYASVSWSF
ncbi:MAG: TonB-dependent receptor [Xanthomonadales bacterium]|nr:TonB-dependent receptor [Xanthomonadales bacterium]